MRRIACWIALSPILQLQHTSHSPSWLPARCTICSGVSIPRTYARTRFLCATRTSSSTTPPSSSPSSTSPIPPLPSSSSASLGTGAALLLSALALPPILAVQQPHDLTLLPYLLQSYNTHYQFIFYNILFATLHSGLASLRPYITPHIGERLYRVIFALASLPSAVALITYFIAHRYDGVQLWQLQGLPGVHEAVYIVTFISFLMLYPATFNLAEVAAIAKPGFRIYESGITRITRHPQLWGQVLWCVAHSAWIGTSFTAVASLCLVSHHCLGAWNGDRRLRNKYGHDWTAYAERTSIIPFAAVLSGKQELRLSEYFRWAYVGVVAFVLGAYAAHPYVLRLVGELKL